jgi:hypothetical protein
MNTATILKRKEIVAVLIELNKKLNESPQPDSLYGHAYRCIFTELRDHYRRQLVALDSNLPYHALAA